MNSWRIALFMLVLIAVVLLVASAIFDWTPFQLVRGAIPAWQRPNFQPVHYRPPAAVARLGSLLTIYLSGLMVLFLFPKRVSVMAGAFTRSGGSLVKLGMLGLLAGLLVLAASLSSALTMATFPLTFFMAMVLFLSGLLGQIALAFKLGRILLTKAGWALASPLLALLLGDLLLFSLISLPGAGIVIILIVASLGLGATIATRFGSNRPWNLSSLTEEGKE